MKIQKKETKLMSLLLATIILLTMQVIPVHAETAEQQAKSKETPANPIHHCTGKDSGTDYTDWNYIYFGSYPQTEVTGTALTSAITRATYDANGDAWINGTKYRRINKKDTENDYYFGNNSYRYFKWEQIKWRVLQNDGKTLFVVADQGLDCKSYHSLGDSITWEYSILRQWLYNSFYSTAFSKQEQETIVEQTVKNEDNPYYGTDGGNDTTDKIYLLSIGETTNSEYGFCENYTIDSVSRRVKASDYAHARGVGIYQSSDDTYAGGCSWWLRTPGGVNHYVADIDNTGCIYSDIAYVGDTGIAVVPALHINLSSELWSMADGGNNNDDNTETTITTIRKTPIKQYDSYNVVRYADTESGQIIRAAVNYNKAIENYLGKLNNQASQDVRGGKKQNKSVGKQLMEKDRDVHTLTYVASDDYAIAAYEMLAQFYDECRNTGIDIGKINITDDYITINSTIIKKIMNSIDDFNRTSRINGYLVHANILSVGGAITGSITVNGVSFLVNSPYDKAAKTMADYINNLSSTTKDVLKQGLSSILTELAHYTYIDKFAEDELKTLFKGKIEGLQKMGYGDLLKVLKGAKKTYNVAKKITAVKSASDLKEALTIDNLKEIYKELSDTDFSDNTIKNQTVNSAYENVMELKKALEDDLFNYIYGYKKEDEGFWQLIKRKININCPVDFTIYNVNNNVVASISDGIVKCNDSNIILELNGDEKVIYILDERNLELQMVATDNGTMDIVVEDMKDGIPISRLNYYDVELKDENIYTQSLNSESISGQLNQFPIHFNETERINADDYFTVTDNASIKISHTSSEGGYVENDLAEAYVKGDPVELYAISYDGYEFAGWYDDEKLVEISPLYRFTAKEDRIVHAEFKEKTINYTVSLYDIEYGKGYDDFAWINLYDKNNSAYDMEFKMYGINEAKYDTSTINILYKKGNTTLSQKNKVTLDKNGEAYLKNVLKKGYESIIITDKNADLVATLTCNGDLPNVDTVSVGTNIIIGEMNYTITKLNKDGTGEVTLIGTVKKKSDKKFTSHKIGNSITINGKSFKITAIGNSAFSGFAKLKTVTLGKNITHIGDKAFYKCIALTKITVPSTVTMIGKQAFSDCKKLKSVTIGKNVISIGDKAFYKCTALTKITIPAKVSKIGKQAFSGCKKLKNITIKTKKLTSKKVGSNAFKGIYGKATIKVPKEKFKVYKKLLKAKGVSSKAKIKK